MIDKFLSVSNPLSFAGFIVNVIIVLAVSAGLCYLSYLQIGDHYHNMPLAIFVMICVASFALPSIGFLIARLVKTN